MDEVLHRCRDLYNGALYEWQEASHLGHRARSYQDQQNELPLLKTECLEYQAVHS